MKTLTCILLCFCMGFSAIQLSAQKSSKKVTITGIVLDTESKPITNAIVMIDGQKTSSITDANGNYKVRVNPDALRIGIFTFGSGIIEEDIAGRTSIDFNFSTQSVLHKTQNMQPDKNRVTDPENQLVNTGYNKIDQHNLTTDVKKVDVNDTKRTYTSIYDMLREVPGVSIRGTTVNIQDSKNFQGFVPPLFIVDGVPVIDINYLSPSNVESIEVLKSTSAAIYGSRGYGGVILITTKSSNETE